jgi:hypothetical protein
MKKLLTLLLIVSSFAYADEWFEGLNQSGGKIVLLTDPCSPRPNAKTLRRMYAAHANGKTLWGCWNFWNESIHVIYDDGESYTYDPNIFVYKKRP